MRNLMTFSTIHEKVKKSKIDYALEDTNHAFMYFALENILSLNEDEVNDAITDGFSDGGIDAVYILDGIVHILSFEYTNTYEITERNFPEGKIDNLIVTSVGIIEKTIAKKDVNEILWDKIQEIWDLFSSGTPSFTFHICSNKEKPTTQARCRLEKGLNKYRHVSYQYYDQEDLVTKILENKFRKVSGSIRFIDRQYYDRSDGPLRGIVGNIYAHDLVNLVRSETTANEINEDAFSENARCYLRLSNRINQSIYDTALSEANYEFWYLNNGITVVCDSCIYTPVPSPNVELKNFQIVNGGQTTHALFEAYVADKAKVENTILLVRICETRDNKIAEKISESTNSQNPIRTRDLRSNDRIQKKLEEQFKDCGFYYERKNNQFENEKKELRINNELIGQLYMAFYLDMPSEARNNKALVFSDMYEKIFNEDETTAERMLVPYRLFKPLETMKKEIQRKKRRRDKIDEKEAFISRAIFHILNATRIIAEKESLDLTIESDISLAISRAIQYMGDIVQTESEVRGDLYTHDKFFKEVPTNKIVRNYISAQYSDTKTTGIGESQV